jgi:hypothetical protein
MISGNPPHHPKPEDEPVTIDLEANAAEKDAAPTETEDRSAARNDFASASPDREEAPAESEPSTAFEPPPAQTASAPTGYGTGTLVASGIVGGLIALICAGAIQYAGLLPAMKPSTDRSGEISALNAEIDALKQSVAKLGTAPVVKPDTELQSRVAALETAMKNPPAAAATGDAGSSQQVAGLKAEVDQLKSKVAETSESQASAGADITKRLDDAEKKLSEPGRDVAVAQAIAAAGLKAAIDRGGSFRPELDTFANISPNDGAVATLRGFADTGVPSRAELIRQVPDVATSIISATQQTDPSESWSDRLVSSAKSLVTVRPVGNIEGDTVEAVTARFEDKIRNGDLPGAVAEWNGLPEAGKNASAAFKQSIEARIKVEDLVGETLSKAIADAGKQS